MFATAALGRVVARSRRAVVVLSSRGPTRGAAHGAAAAARGHGAVAHHDDHGDEHRSDLAKAYDHTEAEPPWDRLGDADEWPAVRNSVLMVLLGAVAAYAHYRANSPGSLDDWARDEAEERYRRSLAGLPVVRGVNYAAVRAMKEAGQVTPEEAQALEAGAITRGR